MNWDTDRIMNFIKEYEKRPILWKKDHKSYYNFVKKEEAWREISDICEEDVASLKKKFESLRGSRRREKCRIRKSKTAGQKDIYVSKWFAWESLKFLDNSKENHTSSEDEEVDKDTTGNFEEKTVKVIHEDNDTEEDSQWEPVNSNKITVNPRKKSFLSSKKDLSKRKRTKDLCIQGTCNILKQESTTERKDKCAMFGDYIAEKIRRFDERTQAILEHRIHDLIFQAEIGTLQIEMQSIPP